LSNEAVTTVSTPLNNDVVVPMRFPCPTARLILLGKSISHPACRTKEKESKEMEAIEAFPNTKLEFFRVAPEICSSKSKRYVGILIN
jgi:hypothetical protein